MRLPVFFAFISLSFAVFSTPPSDFTHAKKIASGLFQTHHETLYCDCHWSNTKDVDLESCHMASANSHSRAHEIEWEHMVPASHLGHDRACWKEDLCTTKAGKPFHGRTCCRQVDKEFRTREAELYNLWPSDGLINQLRQNYEYTALPFSNPTYGCRFIIDKTRHLVEPDDKVKGIVARASLFMAHQYNIQFDREQLALFERWDMLYPPTEWEKTWAQSVKQYEGYDNPFITQHS
jgi:deoxyribonuclease-1